MIACPSAIKIFALNKIARISHYVISTRLADGPKSTEIMGSQVDLLGYLLVRLNVLMCSTHGRMMIVMSMVNKVITKMLIRPLDDPT